MRGSLVLGLLGVLIIIGPAKAQENAPEPVPQIVWDAIAAGNPVKTRAWAFTQTLSSDGDSMIVRFDPRRDGVERWMLVSPQGDDVTAEVEQVLTGLRENSDERSTSLSYNRLSQRIGTQVTRLGAEDGALRFGFVPQVVGEDDDADFLEHIRGELVVRTDHRDGPWVERVVLAAPDSFKPNMMSRISTFEQAVTYERSSGLPLMESARTKVTGRALFQDFEEEVLIEISEVEDTGAR